MQYKNKSIVDIPSAGTKYVPINIHTPYEKKSMAITDIDIIADTSFAKIADDFYLWQEDANAPAADKPVIKLTDSYYKANDLGYDTSIEIVPDGFDASELTTTKDMFSRATDVYNYFDSVGDKPTMSDLQALANNFDSSMVYSHLKEAPEMDTSNVTDMSCMFGCYIDWEILKDYDDPFSDSDVFKYSVGCSSLTTVPRYDTSNVKNFIGMFAGCTSLPKIFPWTIEAYGGDYISLSDFGSGLYNNGFCDMFNGSSVEEVTFSINTPFYAKAWFGDKDPLDFFMILDQENGLKKVTILSGIPDDKVVIDNDGAHYYGLSANN